MSNIASRSFRAVLVASSFSLLACSGGGGGGGGGTSAGPGPSKLFVADEGNRAVGSLINPNPSPGTIAVDRIIQGPSTDLNDCIGINGMPSGQCIPTLPSMALDAARDRLYVARTNFENLVRFDGAGTASGDVHPGLEVTLIGPLNVVLRTRFLHLDTAHDAMYIGDGGTAVSVIDSVSAVTGAAPGTSFVQMPPSRFIQADIGSEVMFGIGVDSARDLLYMATIGFSGAMVSVFTHAGTLNGLHVPDRRFTVGGTGTAAMFLDAGNDRLYVADAAGNVRVYEGASMLTVTPSASRTFVLPFAAQVRIFVDTASDRFYAVTQNRVFIVNGVSSANGAVAGTAITVSNPGVQLSAVVARP
jgi:hypothetical protein